VALASPTLDAGFLEPALDAGFLAVEVEGGLADAPREAGFDVPAAAALDAGFAGADFEAGFALDAGLAFFDGGFSASSSGPLTSSVVRFFPREDLGLGAACSSSAGSPSAGGATLDAAFLALGLAGALLGRSGFGCSLMRLERRGSARVSIAAAAALRGIWMAGNSGRKGRWYGLNWGRGETARILGLLNFIVINNST